MTAVIQKAATGNGDMKHARTIIAMRVEWTLLALRYFLYIFLATVSVASDDPALLRILLIAGTSALAHNIFAHAALYTRVYHLFVSPVNFTLYLARLCLLIFITGGSTSPIAPFLVFVVIGYHIYVPRAANTLGVTLTVGAAYSFTILTEWAILGMDWSHLSLYTNLFLIGFGGWIMNIVARVMYRLEYEAHRQADALQSSETTLRAILDHAAHPILVFDEHGFIMDSNESACTFLGAPRTKLMGKRFQAYVFDDGSLDDSFEELRDAGALDQEMLLIPHDRIERNVEIHIHSFQKDANRFYVCLFHDITEQKEFEETSHQAKIRLEEANNELQRVVALRTEFYANIANRVRSPLSAMLGFTDMLLDESMGELSDEQRAALRSCRRSIMRIFGLLDEVFAPESLPDARQAAQLVEASSHAEIP